MRLRKLAIISGIIVGMLILIVIASSILVRYIISPDAVRKIVLPRVEKALLRHVEIGDVGIGIIKGISLRDLKVYERDGKEVFVSLSAADLRFQLLPLLSKKVVVDKVVLDSPRISIVRNADGTFNFSDLLKKEEPKETGEEKTALSFAVARFSIDDGRVVYNDRKGLAGSPFTYEIGSIDVKSKDFTRERPFPVTFSATVPGASLRYAGSAQLAKDGPALSGELTIGDSDMTKLVAGLPAGISGRMVKLSPRGEFAVKISLEGGIKAPFAMLRSGEIQLKGVGFSPGETPTTLSGDLLLADGAISSRDLAVDLGKDRLSLQLKTSKLDKRPIGIELSASGGTIDLDAASTPVKGGKDTTHPAPPTGKDAGPINLPVKANGSVRVASINYRGLTVSGLSLRYRLADNVLNVDDVKGSVAGGTFADSTMVNLAVPGISYATRLSMNGVQVQKLADAFAPKAKGSVSGVLSARADISGRGTTPASMKRNLTGSGDFDIRNGALSGSGFISELARFLGSQDLRIIRFNSFNGTYRIGGEQILLNSELNGSDIKMKPKGRIGFDKGLDMEIDTRIAPRFTGKVAKGTVGSFVTDEQGWGVLPLKASGTVGSPRFSLSAAAIGSRIKEKAGEVIRKKLFRKEGTGNEESPLEKGIKGLFGN